MKVIPAIDIKGGQCVRLYQGQMDQETVYSDNPLEVARRWEEAGAEMLHVVDLDGAVEGLLLIRISYVRSFLLSRFRYRWAGDKRK